MIVGVGEEAGGRREREVIGSGFTPPLFPPGAYGSRSRRPAAAGRERSASREGREEGRSLPERRAGMKAGAPESLVDFTGQGGQELDVADQMGQFLARSGEIALQLLDALAELLDLRPLLENDLDQVALGETFEGLHFGVMHTSSIGKKTRRNQFYGKSIDRRGGAGAVYYTVLASLSGSAGTGHAVNAAAKAVNGYLFRSSGGVAGPALAGWKA